MVGFTHTKIVWAESTREWRMEDMLDGRLVAFTNSTSDYPLGTHRWFFTSSSCTDPAVSWRTLNLQQEARQPGQFCCDDRLCIASLRRCDNNIQCQDLSDEKDCKLVEIPDKVKVPQPPSSIVRKGREMVFAPLPVEAQVTIENITSIDDATSVMSLKFVITFEWKDPRLTHNFSKHNSQDNPIHQNDVWKPKILFFNMKEQGKPVEVIKWTSVKRLGNATMSGNIESLHVNEIYAGVENPIICETIYQGDFI